MSNSFDLMEMVEHGVAFLGFAASAACLIACIVHRRVSSAMLLLILAFAGDALVSFLYLVLGLANQLLLDYMENTSALYSLVGFVGVASTALIAVGLFQVFGDVTRRLGRSRGGPGTDYDDYERRPRRYDDRDDPRWERGPGGPDIRR